MPRRRYDDHPLRERIDRLPTAPGVYLMKDVSGKVLYVGKAVNLRARVRSYFNGTDGRRRMHHLMRELVQLDVSLAADEREALLLEARLIRQYQPRYNIALKNSFRPNSIRIDLREPFPRLERRPAEDDGAHWFGPLPSAWHAGQILSLIERHFPLRTCDDTELRRQKRPCLQYQLRRCLAPCAGYVTPEDYRQVLDQVMTVLDGGEARLAEQLRRQMGEAADRLDFEKAAILRDRLRGLDGLRAKAPPPVAGLDRDVIGLARIADEVAVAVMPVRWGRQQQARTFYFDGVLTDEAELLTTFLLQRYQVASDIPLEIALPFALPDLEAVTSILVERAERALRVSLPPDAAGLDAVALSAARAELATVRGEDDRAERGAESLSRLLGLNRPARVLEWLRIDLDQRCAWQARLVDGAVESAASRRRSLRATGPLDLTRALELYLAKRGTEALPDVLVLEGGKAALAAAGAVLSGVGATGLALLSFPATPPVAAASPEADADPARELRQIYLPGRRNPLRLPVHSPARRLLRLLCEAGARVVARDG